MIKPVLTIITVCYNDASLLEKTICNILQQKEPSVEYIVIDGASTDETPEVLKRYSKDIDIIVSERDTGIFDAMNKGINLASGDNLLFINAGDLLCKNSLKSIIARLQPGIDVYFCDYYKVATVRGKYLIFDRTKEADLSREIPTCHNAMVFSERAFKNYGHYDTSYKYSADYEWLCRNGNSISVENCDIKLSYIMLGGISEMRNLSVLREKAMIAFKYFGWMAYIRALFRLVSVTPISLLKLFFIKIGIFDQYLLMKHKKHGINENSDLSLFLDNH